MNNMGLMDKFKAGILRKKVDEEYKEQPLVERIKTDGKAEVMNAMHFADDEKLARIADIAKKASKELKE